MTIKRELLVNNSATTLNGAISNSATTITVGDGSQLPSTGNFRCLIDDEIVFVTDRSGNDLTVVRGVEGTSAVSHTDGAAITVVVTAGALKQYLSEASPFAPCSTPARLQDASEVILDSTDFTWDNQGAATVSDSSYGAITIKAPDNASSHSLRMLYKSAPAAPNKIRALIIAGPGIENQTTNGTRFGLAFRESDTGKIISVEFQPPEITGSSNGYLRNVKYTNSTTLSSQLAIANYSDRLWLEIEDDNTDIFFRASVDGDTWHEIFTETRSTFLASAGPDQVGFYINPYDAEAAEAWLHLLAWWEG